MTQTPVRQYLKDYQAPNFLVTTIHLKFEIQEKTTIVTNQMQLKRQSGEPLQLTGPLSGCKEIVLTDSNGSSQKLTEGKDFHLSGETLILNTELESFQLSIVTHIIPSENTSLSGLYQSGTGLCTQCEPEGFRNITFFMDRPDVMARYTTTIIADKKKYPIMLSNGNRVEQKDLDNGLHYVRWEDPFPKPSYLFALVAGDYGVLKDHFVTMTGRKVDLEIYCEHGNEFQCSHALAALKRSMKWDEVTYQREYDLNQYLILAVDDFNGGAMENKGLNIFNSRLVFADSSTATDDDFDRVESVIAHEYFHNWTGNRITLRDWFQLSLKEGLTVFREQHYMGDLSSESLKRIDDVELLRDKQFPEDAGPNAHPVRPSSCLAVDNFYTTTVYEKGAEVIRVLKQLLGPVAFKKGLDDYFATYDGQAITIEHFLLSFEKASGKNLHEFSRWYSQSGTPKVSVEEIHEPITGNYKIRLTQSCPPTPGQDTKEPFVIPVKISLFSPSTKQALPFDNGETEAVLELSTTSKEWTFKSHKERPVPSILRGMTSPVILDWNATNEQLEYLAVNDTDGFNQWESGQKLAVRELTGLYNQLREKKVATVNKYYVSLYQRILETSLTKPELTSRLLQLPSPEYLVQTLPLGLDPEALSGAYEILQETLAKTLNSQLWDIEAEIRKRDKPTDYSYESMGLRQLQHTLWKLLGHLNINSTALGARYDEAKTMNEQAGLIFALNEVPNNERTRVGERFIEQWSHNSLVVNKWLMWHAQFNQPETLKKVIELSQSGHFKVSNPNKVLALYRTFALTNWRGFHRADGEGYKFFGEKLLEVDSLNPSTAARVSQTLENWYRLEPQRKEHVRQILAQLVDGAKLSKNTFEIIKRSLDFDKK